jgi:hypothetical protein
VQPSIPPTPLSSPASPTEERFIERWISAQLDVYQAKEDFAKARISHIYQLAHELRLNIDQEPGSVLGCYRQRRMAQLMVIDQLQAEIEAQRATYAHECQTMIAELDTIQQRRSARELL